MHDAPLEETAGRPRRVAVLRIGAPPHSGMMRPIAPHPGTATDDVAQLRAARSDIAAFSAFYVGNAERLYLWALRATGNAQTATDITAESFAIALEGLGRFRGTEPGSGVAWLFGIARNLIRGWHHERRVADAARVRLGMSAPAWVPEDVCEVDDRIDAERLSDRLRVAMDDLPTGLRDALSLHVLEERSHREVALALGISEPNARMRITRAVRRVRDSLTAQEER